MAIAEGIVGRTKSGDKYDLYETPDWATRLIVDSLIEDNVIEAGQTISEPCSGAGAISRVLLDKGFKVASSDIQVEDFIFGERGVDLYKMGDKTSEVIITNPPYNLMTRGDMLNEFLRVSNDKVVLLLNIYFLSSKDRYDILRNSPLKYVYIHSDRVTMFPYGEPEPKSTGTKMFAWFVWEHGYQGEPAIRWLSKQK